MIDQNVVNNAKALLGERLKQVREEKELSCYAVSEASGVTIASIQQVEEGSSAYTIDTFLKVIHALDVCFYLADKEGKHLDFIDMANKLNAKTK